MATGAEAWMSDTERCAVIGLRSGIVPNDPNTFFDGSQKKCQFSVG
jgi:hypothetical protein